MTIQSEILSKISTSLEPSHMELINESHQHNVPADSETHFKLTCVCEGFIGLSKVKRHQKVYSLLADEFNAGMHALALHLYDPSEWETIGVSPESPKCMGGSKKDAKN